MMLKGWKCPPVTCSGVSWRGTQTSTPFGYTKPRGATPAEDAKEFSRHHARHDRKGTIAVLHHVRKGAIVLDARHAGEHAAPLTQRGKISYGERAQRVIARRFHIDENETLLFLDRERLQQDSIRDAEHRGRGADADGER